MTSSATLILRLALRNVLRYPRRSAITVIAVVVGVWSSITLAALARGLSTSIAEGEINTLTGHIQLHAPGYIESPAVDNSMPAPTRELLRVLDTLPNSTWAARVRVPAVVMSERESAGVSLLGIDPERERPLSFISSAIAQGSYLHSADDPGIILGAALLGRLQT